MAPVEMPGDRLANRDALHQEWRFYAIVAFALLIITVVGFRQFVLHGRAPDGSPVTPEILSLVVLHGLAMLA